MDRTFITTTVSTAALATATSVSTIGRCAIRAEANWTELKAAVEARLGLPKAVAQLSSLRGNRDGALIRTGADMEAGEYLDVTLDMRSKNAQAGAKHAILKPQVSLKARWCYIQQCILLFGQK